MKSNQFPIIALVLALTFFFIGKLSSQYKVVKSDQVQGETVQVTPAPGNQEPPTAAPLTYDNVKPVDQDDFYRGNDQASVVLIEYSDTECPFCKRHHETMLKVMENYGDQIAWVYRHYPLPFHQYSQKEAEATECVADLGGLDKFWIYLDKIYEETESNDGLNPERLVPMAGELGLDQTKVKECIDSGKFAQNVADDLASGQKAGVQGTPGTILITKDGQAELIGGALPYEQIEETIKKYL
jgi:protein-disulfide isomerase